MTSQPPTDGSRAPGPDAASPGATTPGPAATTTDTDTATATDTDLPVGGRPGRQLSRRTAVGVVSVGAASVVWGCSPSTSTRQGPSAAAAGSTAASPSGARSPAAPGEALPPSASGSAAHVSGSATGPAGPATTSPGAPTATSEAFRVAGPAREVRHGPRAGTAVALTFHGAGAVSLAEQLLTLVERAGVPVTVLAVGTWLQSTPEIGHRIVAAGHELGNHTLHHLPMLTLDAGQVRREIDGGAAALRAAVGSAGRWFRASGTQRTDRAIRSAAAAAGYDTCLSYDVDGLDWQDPPVASVVDAVLGGARGGSIISLHLGHQVTLDALPAVLTGLRRRGLHPVTCTGLLGS